MIAWQERMSMIIRSAQNLILIKIFIPVRKPRTLILVPSKLNHGKNSHGRTGIKVAPVSSPIIHYTKLRAVLITFLCDSRVSAIQFGSPSGFRGNGNMTLKSFGTREQKENKAGNTGTKAVFREQGTPKSKNCF